jgi:serpin B
MRRLLLCVALLAGLGSASDLAVVSRGATGLGFGILSSLTQADPSANVLISPTSISLALAMTCNGAAGATRDAMEQTLGISALTAEAANSAYSQLGQALSDPDPQVRLDIANSLWAREGIRFKKSFLRLSEDYFRAQDSNFEAMDPNSVTRINDWVSSHTQGKIDRILDDISPETFLFLFNAIYFKGSWTEAFDARLTRDQEFTLAGGEQEQVPMMNQSGRYRYLKDESFQAAELPYGSGRLSMYVFLPDDGSSLDELIQDLTPENWSSWNAGFKSMKGDISLPKFKFEYQASLNDVLKALGMGPAFDSQADFSAMTETGPKVFISHVMHKTFIEVNEEGTEAAAVTGVVMATGMKPQPEEHFSMTVDRPFLIAVCDQQTAAVLFLGAVRDPR